MSFTDTRALAKWEVVADRIPASVAGVAMAADANSFERRRALATLLSGEQRFIDKVEITSRQAVSGFFLTVYITPAELGVWANTSRRSNSKRCSRSLGADRRPLR
jgi:hypothetical protein